MQSRMARAALGWSTHRLAEMAGVSRSTVVNFEVGATKNLVMLERMEKAFLAAGVVFRDEDGLVGVMMPARLEDRKASVFALDDTKTGHGEMERERGLVIGTHPWPGLSLSRTAHAFQALTVCHDQLGLLRNVAGDRQGFEAKRVWLIERNTTADCMYVMSAGEVIASRLRR